MARGRGGAGRGGRALSGPARPCPTSRRPPVELCAARLAVCRFEFPPRTSRRHESAPLPPTVCAVLLLLPAKALAGDLGFSFRAEPADAEEVARGGRGRPGRRADIGPGPRRRRPKLISFSTDNSQIGVELGFTVPLLKVPLQGARTDAGSDGPGSPGPLFKKPIDVNIGALFVAGSMLLTVMGIVPAVYQAFAKPHHLQARSATDREGQGEPGATGHGDVFPESLWQGAKHLLAAADAALALRGVDAWSCGGRALCTALAGAAERVRGGGAGSMDLVLHGVARSPWVSQWVTGTKFQDAASGEEDSDHCTRRFSQCELPTDLVSLFADANNGIPSETE